MTSNIAVLCAATLSLIGVLQANQASNASRQLPQEATSVQEIYENWTVGCAQRDGKKVCTLSQQQMDKDSRQRALAFELTAVAPEKAEGSLLLPFGLAVDREVVLQVDGGALSSPLHFRTCVPAGCLVTLAFDVRAITGLKGGNALTVKTTADGGQPITFTLALKGFSSAFDRTAALLK